MLQNIKSHLKPHGDGKGGTYFGATGCGKTHIMLYLTRLLALRKREIFNNPTVVIIEDREDLDRVKAGMEYSEENRRRQGKIHAS